MKNNKINVGIGFATGRKNFRRVLRTYIHNWRECGLVGMENIRLNLIVAYDLTYSNTQESDYVNISNTLLDMIDGVNFIGCTKKEKETPLLFSEGVISKEAEKLLFGNGYAAKRNAILYTAIKNGIDYLLFLDDDEYPVAVTNTRSTAVWGGQHVLLTHITHIKNADITNGHHCGYISPIPFIRFNDTMTEDVFKTFIEAISNDIISWDSIRLIMKNGGVTYANTEFLTSDAVQEVEEVQKAKFITGANLCINLTNPSRVFPFYNPPGARGEDTFLSTMLSERKVLRVPCYAFHDGFSTYHHLLDGVLPIRLKRIEADSEQIVERFYRACIGWIRYKPLFLYITKRDKYNEKIDEMRRNLSKTLPIVCDFFGCQDFMNVAKELELYHKNVTKHYNQYRSTQENWSILMKCLSDNQANR